MKFFEFNKSDFEHIVDECIYTNHEYDIAGLQKLYAEKFDGEEWFK